MNGGRSYHTEKAEILGRPPPPNGHAWAECGRLEAEQARQNQHRIGGAEMDAEQMDAVHAEIQARHDAYMRDTPAEQIEAERARMRAVYARSWPEGAPAGGWEGVIERRRDLTDSTKTVARMLAVTIATGDPSPPIEQLGLDTELSDRTVRRALSALFDGGWLERDGGGYRLLLPRRSLQPTPEPDAWAACLVCDGTGSIEIPPPPGAAGGEQPWTVKCQECDGRGRRPIGEVGPAIAARAPTDAELTEHWARHGIERRGDGDLYPIGGDRALRLAIPEDAKPPRPDGTRPEAVAR